jgi:nitronate monooxygenase
MGNVAGPRLAAAVSNAGGLGVLGVSHLVPDEIRGWIRKTKGLTNRPFGVDVLLPAKLPPSGMVGDLRSLLPAEQVAYVQGLRKALGVEDIEWEWKAELTADLPKLQVQAILDERVPVLVCGLGSPDWVVSAAHSVGTKVVGLVGNVRNARKEAARAVDIIVAQGHEAGGHTGRIGTLALVPQVVDAVRPTPVVAAGGIADGRGLAAALCLGAIGVLVGTAFVATHEAGIDHIEIGQRSQAEVDALKSKILQATEEDTVVTKVLTGKTLRAVLPNRLVETWEADKMTTLPMPFQSILIADLLEGLRRTGRAEYLGGPAGQVSGMLKQMRSARQLIDEMVRGALTSLDAIP